MKRRQYSIIVSWAVIVWAYIFVLYKVGQVQELPEEITCEERYIWDTYWGEIRYKDWDYIYLSWYHQLDTICTPYEDMVDEETPLCWTTLQFNWPLDTSNMNCYYDNPKSKLKAFKKQMEDEKKEDERYYTCNIDSYHVIELYNSCETSACAENTLRRYFSETCPRANVK